jgi:hypothetical protein
MGVLSSPMVQPYVLPKGAVLQYISTEIQGGAQIRPPTTPLIIS